MRGFDWKSMAAALVTCAVGFWLLQPGASSRVEDRLAAIAARMQGATQQTMGDGSTLRSVMARGRTLTLGIDGSSDAAAASTAAETNAARAAELCGQADIRELIAAGAQVVIESRTAAGEPLPTLRVDRCETP